MTDIEEARKAMIAKRFGGNTQGASTGGAGSARRKNKGSIKAGAGNHHLSLVFIRTWCLTLFLCIIRRQEVERRAEEDGFD
jgi:hypothetical protein